MKSTFVSRIAAMGLAALALSVSAFTVSARADVAAEQYVQANATQAINSLSAVGTPAERSAKFGQLMEQFSDFPQLSEFVLGIYARPLRANPALKQEWSTTFRDFAVATYEDQLDRYRGSALKVTGSKDFLRNTQACSRVGTEMSQKNASPLLVYWYLCKNGAADWKVSDVGLQIGDSEMKLAITQRDQFVAFLGSNGGDVSKLIARVKQQTATMKAHLGAPAKTKRG